MEELNSIAQIVKSPESTREILKLLLGYQIFSPIAKETGAGLSIVVKDNLERVRQVILRKQKESDQATNLRVAMEGFRSAAFVDSKIAAEYFGGILASSGASEDDALISYLAIIKDLSSRQLHLHYVIYRSLHNLILTNVDWQQKNLALDTDVNTLKIVFSRLETESINLSPSEDSEVLYRQGLISRYKYGQEKIDDGLGLPYVEFTPTSLGFQLYAVAHNEFGNWRHLDKLKLEPFPEINTASIYFQDIDGLKKFAVLNHSEDNSDNSQSTAV